jgi:SH3-like domain-containing protein
LQAALACALALAAGASAAQDASPTNTATAPRIGAFSGQPLPRFVSVKSSTANARRGPSMTHRIDWVFRHPGLPVIVTAEYGHWRRVRDRDGLGGWIHYALLSGVRTVIVDVDMADLRRRPDRDAPVVARLERGAIARLGTCENGWCELGAGRHHGWAEEAALWGVSLRMDTAAATAAAE